MDLILGLVSWAFRSALWIILTKLRQFLWHTGIHGFTISAPKKPRKKSNWLQKECDHHDVGLILHLLLEYEILFYCFSCSFMKFYFVTFLILTRLVCSSVSKNALISLAIWVLWEETLPPLAPFWEGGVIVLLLVYSFPSFLFLRIS